MNRETMNKDLKAGLAWVGATLAVTLGAVLALKLGHVGNDTFNRVVIGFNGLMVVWSGNRTPKAFIPSARVRQLARVSGRSMVLSGLFYTGLWAFAPIPVAATVGSGVVMAGIAMTLGYAFWLHTKAKAV